MILWAKKLPQNFFGALRRYLTKMPRISNEIVYIFEDLHQIFDSNMIYQFFSLKVLLCLIM